MDHNETVEPLFKGLLDHESEPVRLILEAAETCFLDHGYHGTSIRDIAEAAGVSKSLLHYHFQSKEHLFLEVQVRAFNRFAAQVTAAVGEEDSPTRRGLAALDGLLALLRASRDFPIQAEIWARSLTNEKVKAHVVRLREYLREKIIETSERVLGDHWDTIPMGKAAAADLLFAIMTGLGIQASSEGSRERTEAAFQGIYSLVKSVLEMTESRSRNSQSTKIAHEGEGDGNT